MRSVAFAALMACASAVCAQTDIVPGPFEAFVDRAIDGDTLDAAIYVYPWPDEIIVKRRAIRLRGVDTPELNSSSACEREMAKAAREFTRASVFSRGPHGVPQVVLYNVEVGQFAGRVIADVVLLIPDASGEVARIDLSRAILSKPFGREYRRYRRGEKPAWCEDEEG